MRTIEAARRVTKTDENCDDIPKLERALDELFGTELDSYVESWSKWNEENKERQRLKGYWIVRWLCTDTHVGEMAYFLDDELVFTCEQSARKNDASIYFVDQAAYEKVKAFIDFFRQPATFLSPDFIEDQETPEIQTFQWADSCMHKWGTYQGRKVEVMHIPYNVRRDLNLPGSEEGSFYALFPYVYIYDEHGVKVPVLVSEITFGIHIDGN